MEGSFKTFMTHLSVVIPVFNERSLITELISRVKHNVELITGDFEIILVDDGSDDDTWNLIQIEARKEDRIKGLKFSRNFGHHYAITAGLHNSRGEWVVVMDGDLQDRPEVIPALYKKAISGFDVVFVSRQNRPEKFYYRSAQRMFYWFLRRLSGINFDSRQANFSVLNKKVVEAFRLFPEHARFYSSTIKWLGFERSFILADHGTRHSGRPSYTLRKRIKLAADIILSFSERPLRFAIGFGITMSLSAILMAIWIFWRSVYFEFVDLGVSSILVAIFFVGGSILVVLGILGIYLGRVFNQVKNRPLYIITAEIN